MSLTDQQQDRLDRLKMLVTIRVDEFRGTSETNDTAVPSGDVEYELTQSAKAVTAKVPRNVSFFATSGYHYDIVSETSNNGAIIPLPSDYCRFTRFKMKGWDLPVNEYYSDDSTAYRQQQYEMRRGTVEKPAVFLIPYTKKFKAGTAPDILAKQISGKAIPHTGDTLEKSDDAAMILDIDDPDYIHLKAKSGYTAEAGDVLTCKEDSEIIYELSVEYLAGDTYYRQSEARQALEVYPYGKGEIEEQLYVPYMKPWEVPTIFEDLLVWHATSSVLGVMRRPNDAKLALERMLMAQNDISGGLYGQEQPRQPQ
jgi:hypothetical protein